jgi:uncharacterized protein YodC (DUF2158 family)
MMKRQTYAPSELTKCPEPLNGAILKSGGPIMAVLGYDQDGKAICEWDDGRARFAPVSIYRLIPYKPEEDKEA